MSLPVQTPYNVYTATGATVYPFEFRLLSADDLQVTLDGVPTAAYTLNGVGNQAGGDVVFNVAPLNGVQIVIRRVVSLARSIDYANSGDFLAGTVNADFDRLWMAMQERAVDVDRALRAPIPETMTELPPAAERADRLLSFDSLGNPIVVAPVSGSASALAIDLASRNAASKAAGQIGFNPALNYVAGTLGWALMQGEWNLMWFDDVRAAVTAGTDCTAAVEAVKALKLATYGGGDLYVPRAPSGGDWIFEGLPAGADGMKTGFSIPFVAGNPDPTKGVRVRFEKGAVWKCGSDNMILVRTSRNHTTLIDGVLDRNGHSNVILHGIVPMDMTSTTEWACQMHITTYGMRYLGGPGAEEVVIQPGPHVGGADSGCFYMNFYDDLGNSIGGGRHIHYRKNADWASHPNRPTRINYWGPALLRGNVGYDFEVGSEITVFGGHEELIANGITPKATPTARAIGSDASNVLFVAGYSEACSKSVALAAHGILKSFGYIPASGSPIDFRTYASAWADATDEDLPWTPTVSGTGGSISTNRSSGDSTKQGKTVTGQITIDYDKGTVSGDLQINGFPFPADSGWALQGLMITAHTGITFPANVGTFGARISGSTIQPIFSLNNGGTGVTRLNASHVTASAFTLTIMFTVKKV